MGIGIALTVLCLITGFAVSDELGYKDIKSAKESMFEDYDKKHSTVIRDGFDSEYILEKITVKASDDSFLGYIYTVRTYDSWGTITLLVGIDSSNNLEGLEILTNDQSYAPIVEEHIIAEYIAGLDLESIKGIDVHCGATNSATKVQNMVIAAFLDCMGGAQ